MELNLTGQISIQQVLAEIREHPTKAFWLAFVRASGKEVGSIKVVAKTLYGAPKRATGSGGGMIPVKDDRKRAMHVEKGTLPCTDYDKDEYITPLISHIIGYNLMKVVH